LWHVLGLRYMQEGPISAAACEANPGAIGFEATAGEPVAWPITVRDAAGNTLDFCQRMAGSAGVCRLLPRLGRGGRREQNGTLSPYWCSCGACSAIMSLWVQTHFGATLTSNDDKMVVIVGNVSCGADFVLRASLRPIIAGSASLGDFVASLFPVTTSYVTNVPQKKLHGLSRVVSEGTND